MDGYDTVNLLLEILAEIKGMRKDYAEGQAVYAEHVSVGHVDLEWMYNKSYEG